MLRFPSETLTVVLGRGRVGGLLACGGRHRLLETVHAVDGAASVPAALQLLERWLQAQEGRGRRIRLILADSLVRYALLPPSAVPLRAAEDAVLLEARFTELYGAMPEWTMLAEAQRHGQSRLACAIPAALAAGARELCAASGSRLVSLQPYFIACWNRWRGQIGAGEGMLAVLAGDDLVLAGFGRQRWHSVRASRIAAAPQTLGDTIHREKLLHGLAPDLPVWLHAPLGQAQLAPLGQPLAPLGHPLASAGQGGGCLTQAMALAAVGA